MDTERVQVGWRFLFWWVLASTVVLALGLAVGFFATVLSHAFFFVSKLGVVGEALNFAVGGAVAGALLGSAQQRYLRRGVLPADWWVLASTVGWAVGAGMGGAVDLVVGGEGLNFALMVAVGGASVGIAQWLVLRRQVARAGWWVLTNTLVGGALGGAVDLVVGGLGGLDASAGLAVLAIIPLLPVGGFLASAVYGVITGGVLVWLLRQPVTQEPSLPQDAV